MKKKSIVPLVLSFVMGSQPIGVLAEEIYNANDTQNGKFVLDMDLSMPTKNQEFSIELKSAGSTVSETATAVDNAIHFEKEMEAGEYTLTIKSKNYATYTKEIVIESSYATSLSLDNNRMNYDETTTENQRGIMAVGDVNGDGEVNKTDSKTLIDAIENGLTDTANDVNADSKVDLTDLTLVAINKGGNTDSATEKTVLPSVLNISKDNNTVVNGNITNILDEDAGKVQLSTTSGAEISETNPVQLEVTPKDSTANLAVDGIVIKTPENAESTIAGGVITVEDANGETYEATIVKTNGLTTLARSSATATVQADGSVVVNIGRQVAIKKVTIKITSTVGANPALVDIAHVEFVNGMENRIPDPQLNIPEITKIEAINDKSFSVEWTAQTNVASYNVSVSGGGKSQVYQTEDNKIVISSVDGELKTGIPYLVMVQSVNGDWTSAYSEPRGITLRPTKVPDAPESVTLTAEVGSISVSWKAMDSTDYYNVYYKASDEDTYSVVKNITGNSTKLTDLRAGVKYSVYVTGVNDLGESAKSIVNEATPLVDTPVTFPQYKLINTGDEKGKVTDHIVGVEISTHSTVNNVGGEFSVVDNDPSTYLAVNDWDTGSSYDNYRGPMITLDGEYEFDTLRFSANAMYNYDTIGAAIRYRQSDGTMSKKIPASTVTSKKDVNGKKYYVVKFDEPIKTDKFQLNIHGYGGSKQCIAELKIYNYDSIENDVNALFADNLHLELSEGVTADTIAKLEERLEVKDNGEYHPDRDALLKEIEAAKTLLGDSGLTSTILNIDTSITNRADGHLDFAMTISDLQPTGISARTGDTIVLYVGSPGVADGTATNLTLYSTQIHGEHNKWLKSLGTLKTGRNEITIESPSTTSDEQGGALYIGYSGSKSAKQYSVRLGTEQNIPTLDITKGKTRDEKLALAKEYVEKLESHVSSLETKHNEAHSGYTYNEKTCTLNFTDIVMDNMMYSFPATQVLKGISSNASTTDAKAERLLKSLEAMEQEIDLFYQHRGLNKNNTDTNRYPTQRLNIRYSKMFAGAFMYAGGKHIGIEFDSVTGLFGTTPIESDEKGKYISGSYSGWGIAHEIGHVINSGKYVHAEVTNNVFSMLAQSQDNNATARMKYPKVYEHVTSGKKGISNDQATQLTMYWQLHMFYDNYYNYKTFDNFSDQFDNLFYARVSSYTRNPSSAPNGLSLNSDSINNFVRLACAAANKNLLPYFEAWGVTPNADTIAYAEKFEKETAKIQYLDDDSRNYRLAGGKGMSNGTTVTSSLDYKDNSKQVTINLSNSNSNSNAMLGYEIIRNGKVVAFVTADNTSYVDTIKTENNRVYEYKVIGYDRLLNTTSVSNAGSVKVSHDGSIGKDGWIAETNMVSTNDETIVAGDDTGYCEDDTISAIKDVINDNYSDSYTGTATGNAEIVLDLNGKEQVTAVKYSSDDTTQHSYTIYVSDDKSSWTEVKKGTLAGTETETIYFNKEDDPCMYIYDASYVKIVFNSKTVTLSELDILGPTGDNVELLQSGIGKLSEDFKYGTNEDEVMKAGSTVVTGTYKGNPAFNVVLLKDEDGNIINGEQVILAEVPANGSIGEVASGTWVYKIDDSINISSLSKVKAELYRVDNPETLEGQRLVSDTMYTNIPSSIPSIKLESTVTLTEEVAPEVAPEEELAPEVTPENPEVTEPVEEKPADEVVVDEENKDETVSNDEVDNEENKDETVSNDEVDNEENADNSDEADVDSPIVVTPMPSEDNTEVVAPEASEDDSDLILEGSDSNAPLLSNIKFETSELKKSATVKLKNTDGVPFLAVQTQIKVSDPEKVSEVTMNWSDKAKESELKECIFNKDKGTISIYVVSKEPLSYDEDFVLGDVTVNSEATSVNLEVDDTKTVFVSSDFEQFNGENAGSSIEIDMENQTPNPPSKPNKPHKPNTGGSSSSDDDDDDSTTTEKPSETPEEEKPSDTTGTTADKVFGDISSNAWYFNAVNKAYQNKWFSGLTPTTFGPDNNMTRAMLVTVLGRFDNANTSAVATQFIDVPTDMYYAPYVAWAKNNNIVSGMSDVEFAPNSDITREQLAVMVYNYLKFKDVDMSQATNSTQFTDANEISTWATEAVNAMKALGIVNGRPDGSFNPKGTATRAEIATILSNIDSMNIIK